MLVAEKGNTLEKTLGKQQILFCSPCCEGYISSYKRKRNRLSLIASSES